MAQSCCPMWVCRVTSPYWVMTLSGTTRKTSSVLWKASVPSSSQTSSRSYCIWWQIVGIWVDLWKDISRILHPTPHQIKLILDYPRGQWCHLLYTKFLYLGGQSPLWQFQSQLLPVLRVLLQCWAADNPLRLHAPRAMCTGEIGLLSGELVSWRTLLFLNSAMKALLFSFSL